MRILVFAWVVVLVACVLHITHAGETKRKKLVLVVPEKVRHIHHHHVKKIYIKSKPHYTTFEEGFHREDSGSYEEDDDIGGIKIKSHGHHKRHSGSRHEHKEDSKKVVVHSEEVPDSSDWHEDKSTEVHQNYGDHASAASIISKLTSQPTKSSSESSSEEEQRTIVFLDNEGSMTESPRGHVKTVHHHHHHHHPHGTKEKSSSSTLHNAEPHTSESERSQNIEQVRTQNLQPVRSQNPEKVRSQNFEDVRPQTLEQVRSQNFEDVRPKTLEPVRSQNFEDVRPQTLEQVRSQNFEDVRSQNLEPIRPQNIINHGPERSIPHAPEKLLNHGPNRPTSHLNYEPNRPPTHINHESNRPHVHINHGGKPPLPRGKPFLNDVGKRPGGNSTFIENLVPPPVNQQSFTRVVHGSTGYSHGQPAGSHPPKQNHPPGRPTPLARPTPPAKTITGPVPQNIPSRVTAPGNHGIKSTFFHNNNQQLHLWKKR